MYTHQSTSRPPALIDILSPTFVFQSNPGHKRFGGNYREDRTVPRKTERGYVDSRPREGRRREFSHGFLSGFRVDSVPPPRERDQDIRGNPAKDQYIGVAPIARS